jgi:hypothetical protein
MVGGGTWMTKTRRLSLRVDEATYQALTRGSKALDMSISEYLRFLTLKSADVVNVGLMDYVAQQMIKVVEADLARLRTYWAAHPEQLLQAVPGGVYDDTREGSR